MTRRTKEGNLTWNKFYTLYVYSIVFFFKSLIISIYIKWFRFNFLSLFRKFDQCRFGIMGIRIRLPREEDARCGGMKENV